MNNTEIKKLELKMQALKESFARKVAAYEEEIAEIRADATLMFEQMNARIAELEGKSEEGALVPQKEI